VLATSATAYVIEPNTRTGHYLIIPEDHYEDLQQLGDQWWSDASQLLAQLPLPDSYNLSINIGETAGQKMKHLHFWIIPRQANQPSSGKGMAALIAEVDATD
jgi:diadenosine tetraphosphate (Ap4A) HIT family hydrolase